MKHIGERIKNLRIEHGMTLKELGTAIEFNYSNLSKIERGSRKPAIEVLENLSSYFQIDISYFFTGQKNLQNEEKQLKRLSKEMKEKNISLEELRELMNEFEAMKLGRSSME
ncbi:helix-turn-helix transcriptional regulator [Anaerobacillus sp. CMMVII]|uniref:helix-turn-helix domain-containing protein n=1 Tax=Anaerobacillus sp. CMMVII TaxID=2755588 RepID=UPI0021B7E737|nr:helix-turn-helix transcriptional regulator [Anaerobacillus sp. CMMVII]MCT8139005.1 helix-turn-helix transcriptional regulator [Anaerobacillus sp. CMMVII]